jgi:hypothetical protein
MMIEQPTLFDSRSDDLPPVERAVALYLSDNASSGSPVALRDVLGMLASRFAWQINEREVKAIIRELRRTYGLPVMSRKGRPSGYWLCSSVEEMQEWIRTFKAQSLDELATLAKVVRVNYPQLAGQIEIEFKTA